MYESFLMCDLFVHLFVQIFLNDLTSKLVNGLRLRQMRVTPNSCPKAEDVRPFIRQDCADEYGMEDEERRDFKYSWDRPFEGSLLMFLFFKSACAKYKIPDEFIRTLQF